MIYKLKNNISEGYKNLKKTILGKEFSWYYYPASVENCYNPNNEYNNTYFLGHVFLERPEIRRYSKMWSAFGEDAVALIDETIADNKIYLSKESKPLEKYLILRINANMTFPTPDTRRTPPHEDHTFKHLNMIFYLTPSGGRTFCGEDEHDPEEDDIILFKGEHNFELSKYQPRTIIVATILPLEQFINTNMGEEFVAVIKLVSGEEILASVCVDETGEEPIIIAHTPVTMKMINNGMYVKIKPWMDLADDDMFVFRTDKIITMSEVKDQKVIKIYERYVEEENEENDMNKLLPSGGEVKPDQKMGYVSTVEDARKSLENIFKNNIEPNNP